MPLLLKESSTSSSTSYVYGPGGLPLEQVSGSTTLWYHHDQIGSTRLITNSSGVSQATYIYDPYGGLASSTGSITNPFRFAGQYQDSSSSESGLYYLRARYYDWGTGQFTTSDPEVAKTRQPYAYVAGSPLDGIDNSGLCSWALWVLLPGTCAEEKLGVYTHLRGTPLAQPLAAVGTATGNAIGGATDFVTNHAVIGIGECVVACFGLSYQGGYLNVQVGGVGLLDRGPYIGYANEPATKRGSDCYAGALGVEIGLSGSICNGANGTLNSGDWEIDGFSCGPSFMVGKSATVATFDTNPILKFIFGS